MKGATAAGLVGARTLYGVQFLRGLAAMLVVLFHATLMVRERFGVGTACHFGSAGVDVFFAISGFVMVVTTCHYWGRAGMWLEFLLRRLIRIVPLYWCAMLVKIAATLAFPALSLHTVLSGWHILSSFLFIPAWNAEHQAFPLLPVGWTLDFEMLFYCLFAAALAWRVSPLWWLSGLLFLVSLFSLLQPERLGAVGTLVNPILLEFVFGMLIGWATVSGHRLSVRLAWFGAPSAMIALVCTQMLPEPVAIAYRLGLWGVPGAVLLLSVVSLEAPCRTWLVGLPTLLGDASYSIYLTHGFVLPLVGVLLLKLHLTSPGWTLFAVVAGFTASAVAGVVVHRRFERPVTRYLSDWLRYRKHKGEMASVATLNKAPS